MLKLNPQLALLKIEGWNLAFWWQRRHPTKTDMSYAPGPFLGADRDLNRSRAAGYEVTILTRPDGRNRPSILAPSIPAVAARWPRLVAAIAAANSLTIDDATWVLWAYIRGDRWTLFTKLTSEMLDLAVQKWFGRMADGTRDEDRDLVQYRRQNAIHRRACVKKFNSAEQDYIARQNQK